MQETRMQNVSVVNMERNAVDRVLKGIESDSDGSAVRLRWWRGAAGKRRGVAGRGAR